MRRTKRGLRRIWAYISKGRMEFHRIRDGRDLRSAWNRPVNLRRHCKSRIRSAEKERPHMDHFVIKPRSKGIAYQSVIANLACRSVSLAEWPTLRLNPHADCRMWDASGMHRPFRGDRSGVFMPECVSGGSADLADESSRRLRDVGCIRHASASSVSRRSVGVFMPECVSGGSADLADESTRRLRDAFGMHRSLRDN